jgi:hypothetical protein
VQSPVDGQVSSQLPAEQSAVHGDVLHDAAQLPDEQLQVPPVQGVLLRGVPVPGSTTAGPPLGVFVVEVLLEPLHAAIVDSERIVEANKARIEVEPTFREMKRCGGRPSDHWTAGLMLRRDGNTP